jgi:hypothetical protein
MVWMYKCPSNTDFSSCSGDGQKWFKIDQEGLISPPLTGTNWGTGVIYAKLQWSSKVPASLAPGTYLVRHELIALHTSNQPQFYAECAQVIVTGSGTAQPSGSYLANIPGYASQSDPGITV